MLLNVNFVYEATVRFRRKLSDSEARYVGSVAVEVREVDPAEAPVAIRFKASSTYQDAPDVDMELRLVGDELYEPMYEVPPRSGFDPVACTPRSAAWLEGIAATGHLRRDSSPTLPLSVGVSYERYGVPRRAAEDENLKSVTASKEGEIAAKIAGEAASMVLVGGVLHRRCPEPVYRVEYVSADRRNGRSYSYLSVSFRETSPAASREYRLDELDHVRETRPLVRIDDGLAELVIPEAVRSDLPHRLYLGAATEVCDWMRARIADGDVAFFSAYHDLREALARDGVLVARGDAALPGDAGAKAREALGRIAGVAQAVVERLGELPNDRRSDLRKQQLRLEALGVWRALDDAAVMSL